MLLLMKVLMQKPTIPPGQEGGSLLASPNKNVDLVRSDTCASARVSSKFLPFRDNLVEGENGLVVQDAASVLPFREDQLERENGPVLI